MVKNIFNQTKEWISAFAKIPSWNKSSVSFRPLYLSPWFQFLSFCVWNFHQLHKRGCIICRHWMKPSVFRRDKLIFLSFQDCDENIITTVLSALSTELESGCGSTVFVWRRRKRKPTSLDLCNDQNTPSLFDLWSESVNVKICNRLQNNVTMLFTFTTGCQVMTKSGSKLRCLCHRNTWVFKLKRSQGCLDFHRPESPGADWCKSNKSFMRFETKMHSCRWGYRLVPSVFMLRQAVLAQTHRHGIIVIKTFAKISIYKYIIKCSLQTRTLSQLLSLRCERWCIFVLQIYFWIKLLSWPPVLMLS